MTARKPFDRSREWKIVGRNPRIRFRPRRPPVGETIEVTLYRGDFDLFTAVRARGELHIDVWSRSRLALGR